MKKRYPNASQRWASLLFRRLNKHKKLLVFSRSLPDDWFAAPCSVSLNFSFFFLTSDAIISVHGYIDGNPKQA